MALARNSNPSSTPFPILLSRYVLLLQRKHRFAVHSVLTQDSSSFARCLDLRDKYIALSYQRLGDNPRDHDGQFSGFSPPAAADVYGLKADADPAVVAAAEAAAVAPPSAPPHTGPKGLNGHGTASLAAGSTLDPDDVRAGLPDLPKWPIYPPPPPPHWHWRPTPQGAVLPEHSASPSGEAQEPALPPSLINRSEDGDDMPLPPQQPGASGQGKKDSATSEGKDMEVFQFADCAVPGEAEGAQRCEFGLNEEGVFRVWFVHDPAAGPIRDGAATPTPGSTQASAEGNSANGPSAPQPPAPAAAAAAESVSEQRMIARVPDLREYFSDLDYLLGVCSDGPAKSFAFRRLKYLASKWSLYCLLNEYQELADMKVGLCSPAVLAWDGGHGAGARWRREC